MGVPIRWVKAAVNDTVDAIDSLISNAKPQISTVIDDASQPYGVTFTAQEKVWLTAYTLHRLYLRDV